MTRKNLLIGAVALAAAPFLFRWATAGRDRTGTDRTVSRNGSTASRETATAAGRERIGADVERNLLLGPHGGRRRAAARPRPIPDEARRLFRGHAEALVDALVRASRARRDDGESAAPRDRAEKERTAVIELMRRHPALSRELARSLDSVPDDLVVRQLGQVLSFADDPVLVADMRRRARTDPRAAVRRAALLALEARSWSTWSDVAAAVYAADPEPQVRDTASAVLGRGLLDRRYRDRHGELRTTIAQALASDEPLDRERALHALLHDRSRDSAAVELARPLRRDRDARVRAAAERVLRAFDRSD